MRTFNPDQPKDEIERRLAKARQRRMDRTIAERQRHWSRRAREKA